MTTSTNFLIRDRLNQDRFVIRVRRRCNGVHVLINCSDTVRHTQHRIMESCQNYYVVRGTLLYLTLHLRCNRAQESIDMRWKLTGSATDDVTSQEGMEIPLTGALGSVNGLMFDIWGARSGSFETHVGTIIIGLTCRRLQPNSKEEESRFIRYVGTCTPNCCLRCQLCHLFQN